MPSAFGRKSSLLISGILCIVFLTGCAPAPGSPKSPVAFSHEAGAVLSDMDRQNTDSLPLLLVPDMEAVAQSDEHRRIFTRHFEVPSVPEATRAQRELVKEVVDAFKATNVPDVSAGTFPAAELNVRSHLTAVSTQVLGIRVNTYESSGAGGATRYLTQWFEQGSPQAMGTRDLFGSDDDWADFKEFVVQAATIDPRVFTGSLMGLEDSWLDSVNFDRLGNALVEFDDNSLGTGSVGPLTVTVSAEQVSALLSDFGTLARTASMSPSPRIQLGLSQDSLAPGTDLPLAREPGNPPSPRSIDCKTEKCVALTFDDGPGPKTGKLLDSLRDGKAPSTFFVTGPNAMLRPEILQRMVSEGHEIGNHSWNHRSFTSLSSAEIRSEIDRTNDVISQAVNQPAALLRPPFGAHNSISDRLSSTPVILWDVDTLDWKHRNAEKVVDSAIRQTRPGSIVLLHDIHSSTVAAVPRILSGLQAKGYTFVTVTELMGPAGLEAGETYARGPQPAKPENRKTGKAGR